MRQGLGPNTNPAEIQKTAFNQEYYRETLAEGIELVVAPRVVVTWDEFVNAAPNNSIALDGFVHGSPKFDYNGRHANFNHHEEVDRLGTRSTCAQVYMALKQCLFDTYSSNGKPKMSVFVNDPDQDVCLSVWLIQKHDRVEGAKSEPLINRLVHAEDVLDATAGAYLFDPNSKLMREVAWIFDPYTQARSAGQIFAMDAAEMAKVISSVSERITRYTLGQGEAISLDLRYEVIGGGENWKMIHETGAAARTGLYHDGARAFVSANEVKEGTYSYSLGKMSPFVNFPISELYSVLNAAEGIKSGEADSWGGSDIIGGSPRVSASTLKPKQVEELINRYIATT